MANWRKGSRRDQETRRMLRVSGRGSSRVGREFDLAGIRSADALISCGLVMAMAKFARRPRLAA